MIFFKIYVIMQSRGEKMTTEFVTDYIERKLNENLSYIRYTFYEFKR